MKMKLIKLALLICIAFFGLLACGQKGPLYLPDPVKTEPGTARSHNLN
jgi:predicted small lipoprotein YifL